MTQKSFSLILASRSPRRIEILKSAGFMFKVIPSNSSERFRKNLSLHANLRAISERKAVYVFNTLSVQKNKEILILSADTIVVLQGRVLGKPKNAADARRMLSFLSGKMHQVKTSFTVLCPSEKKVVTRIITTKVGFRQIPVSEIESYVASGEPFDKAGSYAIQGLGRKFVKLIKGDLLNVVGLPIDDVIREFEKNHWVIRSSRKSRVVKRKN